MKRFEIWAHFPNGATPVKVDTYSSLKKARAEAEAMDHANARDEAEGFGFRCGRPVYTIREIEVYKMN